MFREQRVVDNRVFLLGLDKLYRDAMKQHERGELLMCARRVAEALHATPADVPVEGYYVEDQQLTEYFRLLRALQEIDEGSTAAVSSLPEFQRLLEITSAPLFGRPQHHFKLLPTGRDALSQALRDTSPEWTVEKLTAAAYSAAQETDDFSLVGLAARVEDVVVLAAARESVVLYAELMFAGVARRPRWPRYVWKVNQDLVDHAKRFIHTFHVLFGEDLPSPEPAQADRYWHACEDNEILGRCVRLGCDDTTSPMRHYHWAICRADSEYVVQEFWKAEVWTTERYRSALLVGGRCPDL